MTRDLAWRVIDVGGWPYVVAADVDESGWLRVLTFAPTDQGVVDLVGFAVTWSGERAQAVDLAATIAGATGPSTPATGLTSRQIRSAAGYGDLIKHARQELARHMGAPDELESPSFEGYLAARAGRVMADWVGSSDAVQGGGRRDLATPELARFALDYDELLRAGTQRARAALAKKHHITESAAKERLRTARKVGLWATSGSGKPGNATPLAYELAQPEEDS